MKKFFAVFLSLALLLAVIPLGTLTVSADETSGIFRYTVSDGKATITDCVEPTGDLVIPSTLGGYPVTTIGFEAFYDCTGLTSVTIPDSVTTIGNYAFCDCTGLTSVTIGNSVTSIGYDAFRGFTGLTEIHWNAKSVADFTSSSNVFRNAGTGGDGITVTFGNTVEKIPAYLFYGNTSSDRPKIKSITIGDSVTAIGNYAFFDCTGLTSVTIGDSVTTIGGGAFSRCTGLTSVTIGDSVTTIGNGAFEYCTGLTSVTIPDSVTTIGVGAFYWCTGLTSVTIPNSVTSIGGSAFFECTGLTSVTIPDSVTTIGNYAFDGCTGLTSVTIGNSVATIGDAAFECCWELTGVYITDLAAWCNISFVNYSANPLYYAKNLYLNGELVTNLVIPNSVTKIKDYAFYNCTKLASVTIGTGVTTIGDSAFGGCNKLAEVINHSSIKLVKGSWNYGQVAYSAKVVHNDHISRIDNQNGYLFLTLNDTNYLLGYIGTNTDLILPENYNGQNYEIYQYAFYTCTELTSVTIPDSVTTIGEGAFSGCTELTSVTIGNSVTTIGVWAFKDCTGLTSVAISDSVTTIGDEAFSYCTGLTNVTIGSSVTTIDGSAFYRCTGLTSITVAPGNPKYHSTGNCLIKTAGKTLIKGCNTSVIPTDGTVTTIDSSAFYGCTGLTSVTIPDSVTFIGVWAFENCTGLTSVTIPDSVATIGYAAFEGCNNLTIVCYPGSYAMNYAVDNNIPYEIAQTDPGSITTNFTYTVTNGKVTITGYTTVLPGNLEIPSTLDGYPVTAIGDFAFADCITLTGITLPNSITVIGANPFDGCCNLQYNQYDNALYLGTAANPYFYLVKAVSTDITSCDIHKNTKFIGNTAFYECSNLLSVTIPDEIVNVGYGVFNCCDNLKYNPYDNALYLGNTNNPYLYLAMAISSEITSCNIHKDTKLIGTSAFEYCWELTDVTIPNGVTKICDWAFEYCSGLSEVLLPNSITTIGDYAFYGCSELININIPNSVATIGECAFYYCSSLTSITIPDTVNFIDKWAFGGCDDLTIQCYRDSVAMDYAIEDGIPYILLEVIPGDLSGDGVVDAKDVVAFKQVLLSGIIAGTYDAQYDINNDNAVDVRDLVHIKKMMASA